MELGIFLKGFLTGIIIAAPIGPVGALVIQRTVNYGWTSGVVSGLAAAFGDTVFAVIAAFGLTVISGVLIEHEVWFHIIGGVFLILYGIRVFFSKPSLYGASNNNASHYGTFGSALLLTLSNPLVVLSIVALYAILGIVNPAADYGTASFLFAGIFSGGLFLWVVLCYLISGLREKMGQNVMSMVNRITGFFIMACGTYALMSLY